jgi:hypothetical protein
MYDLCFHFPFPSCTLFPLFRFPFPSCTLFPLFRFPLPPALPVYIGEGSELTAATIVVVHGSCAVLGVDNDPESDFALLSE